MTTHSAENLAEKMRKLESLLAPYRKVMLAFSGGVDSTFLLAVLSRSKGKKILAYTAVSSAHPEKERGEARRMANLFPVEHREEVTDEVGLDVFRENPKDRCYHCKKHLFSRMDRLRVQEGYEVLMDGTNADDSSDFRPGMKALEELGVRSPLLDAGLTKSDIRTLSRDMDLPTWDKPSIACLASRFPYGTAITEEALGRVDRCEVFLQDRVRGPVRVRYYDTLARIEASVEAFPMLVEEREAIVSHFRKNGFTYITLDLEGFRSGSMNEVL
jgi:pyridinium-3,5-biscarboxylic acid mononucleotide sulfurtransferase